MYDRAKPLRTTATLLAFAWWALACGSQQPSDDARDVSRDAAELAEDAADTRLAMDLGGADAGAPDALSDALTAPGPQIDDFMFDEVVLPAGTFMMGATHSGGQAYREIEMPPRPVTFSRPLSVATTEVTQGLWEAVTGVNPSAFPACGSRCPVESITLFESLAFANALSEARGLTACYSLATCRGERWSTPCARDAELCTGTFSCAGIPAPAEGCTGYRVPTEAEWEYFARPVEGDYGMGLPDDATSAEREAVVGWHSGNSRASYPGAQLCLDREQIYPCGTQPVAGRMPNAIGLWDVTGNVAEWTTSRTQPVSYGAEPVEDPTNFSDRIERIASRGGAFGSIVSDLRVTHRGRVARDLRATAHGLRLVRSVDGPAPSECARGHRRPSGGCVELLASGPFAPCSEPIGPASTSEIAWITAYWGESWVDAHRKEDGWFWPTGEPITPRPLGVGACLATSADGKLRATPCEETRARVCGAPRL